MAVRLQSYAPATFYPQEDSSYSFLLEAELTQKLYGYMVSKKITYYLLGLFIRYYVPKMSRIQGDAKLFAI
jgi:hypothetical protein